MKLTVPGFVACIFCPRSLQGRIPELLCTISLACCYRSFFFLFPFSLHFWFTPHSRMSIRIKLSIIARPNYIVKSSRKSDCATQGKYFIHVACIFCPSSYQERISEGLCTVTSACCYGMFFFLLFSFSLHFWFTSHSRMSIRIELSIIARPNYMYTITFSRKSDGAIQEKYLT